MAWGLSAAHVDDRGHGVGAATGNTAVERQAAVRVVAGSAWDAGDAAWLLEALGLTASEGRAEEGTAAWPR